MTDFTNRKWRSCLLFLSKERETPTRSVERLKTVSKTMLLQERPSSKCSHRDGSHWKTLSAVAIHPLKPAKKMKIWFGSWSSLTDAQHLMNWRKNLACCCVGLLTALSCPRFRLVGCQGCWLQNRKALGSTTPLLFLVFWKTMTKGFGGDYWLSSHQCDEVGNRRYSFQYWKR